MNFELYGIARSGGASGAIFDGKLTRERIEQILSTVYSPNRKLSAGLHAWADGMFPDSPGVLASVDTSKWVFVSLPGKVKHDPWSDEEVVHTVESYMEMLQSELAGEEYSKTEHRNALLKHLRKRSGPAA